MRGLFAAAMAAAACLACPVQAQQAPAAAPNGLARDAMIGAAIHVSNLERSLRFYRDTLGMRMMAQFNPPGATDKSRPDTVLNFGGGPADTMLMLLSDRDPAGPRKIEHAFGFARVVLRHADLAGLNGKLRDNGFAEGEIKQVHGAVRLMMLRDPDGYTIEIIER